MNDSGRPRPIQSSFTDEPAKQEAIERFVLGLSERIDDLQEAEVQGDFKKIAELASALFESSTKHGYEILSRCCFEVQTAARGHAVEETRKALIELTEVSHRVRLGYRGAL